GEARKKLANTYLSLRDVSNAAPEYSRAADLLPDDLEVQLAAGGFLQLGGKFEEAKDRAEAVLEKEPKNVDAHILVGSALMGLNDPAAAIAQIEEAIKLDPKQSRMYTALGGFLLTQQR